MKYKEFVFGMVALALIGKPLCPRPEEFVRLDGVKSSIVFRNVESEMSFDPGFYRGLRDEDFDAETDILSLNQLRRLARFGARTLPEVFEAPRIVAEVKADFVKKHSLIVVQNIYPSARHTKVLVFIINKDASIIYRLGRYDAEASEIICNLAREDIDRFNAFIRKEGLKITDPCVALDVFRLYLTLARQREIQVIGDRDEFLKGLGAIAPGVKAVSDVPKEIGPGYCRMGDIIRIKFSSYAVSGNTLSLDCWDVSVNKNGVIKPNSNEYLVLQNPL